MSGLAELRARVAARRQADKDERALAELEAANREFERRHAGPFVVSRDHASGEYRSAQALVDYHRYVPRRPELADFEPPPPSLVAYRELRELHRLVTPLWYRCPGCDTWRQVPTGLERLRQLRIDWTTDQYERELIRWRSHPQVIAHGLSQMAEVREKQADARDAREQVDRKQAIGDRMFTGFLHEGLSLAEARDAVAKQVPEWIHGMGD